MYREPSRLIPPHLEEDGESSTCFVEGGFSESELQKTIDSLGGKMGEGFSYVIIKRGKGFDFPAWPVPALLGWD